MKIPVHIQDDFLPNDQFQQLHAKIIGASSHNAPKPEFPWSLVDGVNYPDSATDLPSKYNFQFHHVVFHSMPLLVSEHVDTIYPLLQKIQPDVLIRAKWNLNPCTDNIIEHGLHVDVAYNEKLLECATTSVFYLNSNNGYTVFENGAKVQSVANRLVTFPAHVKHSGSTCTDQKYRVVLNMNYIK